MEGDLALCLAAVRDGDNLDTLGRVDGGVVAQVAWCFCCCCFVGVGGDEGGMRANSMQRGAEVSKKSDGGAEQDACVTQGHSKHSQWPSHMCAGLGRRFSRNEGVRTGGGCRQ